MKYVLTTLLGSLLVTGCFAIPTLDPKYTPVVTETAYYLCQAQKTGADLENLTIEGVQSIIERFQTAGGRTPLLTVAEIQTNIEELTTDPIQMGLFLGALTAATNPCP